MFILSIRYLRNFNTPKEVSGSFERSYPLETCDLEVPDSCCVSPTLTSIVLTE